MEKRKKSHYAVVRGQRPGIYDKWYGVDGAEAQVRGFTNALYEGFYSLEDAKGWWRQFNDTEPQIYFEKRRLRPSSGKSRSTHSKIPDSPLKAGKVVIYTDGGCIKNPGPGGYGAILLYGSHRKEVSAGFRLTTNNRMELMACIEGLKQLRQKSPVVIYSDSKYLVNGIMKGWAKSWRARGWMRNEIDRAENADLWAQLLDLCDKHDVEFVWIRGHAGNMENERCDLLAFEAASKPGLPPDNAYETGRPWNFSGD
ncbi:ribonuclease HI [bacterium]|nr:ribonuclease HI [bacterium]